MTTLADVVPGNQFLFVCLVTSLDANGIGLSLFGPSATLAATALISPQGVMTGSLAIPPNQAQINLVTGFTPVTVGDILTSQVSGETLVAMAAWINPDGTPMWANTTDRKVVYPASGWTVIGHVTL